ncbi:transposase [Actinacidiphila soli]|uniref:transposase n=1 Tax=Actinacidiphila soli TaxID=2487275 RepID=UPI0013E2E079|nr:transposase [Actinacidiphila soli]
MVENGAYGLIDAQQPGGHLVVGGSLGGVFPCQVGVFAAWATSRGAALIDREIYLPRAWADDRERRVAAQVPETACFATKPRLAETMIDRILPQLPTGTWLAADEVYGRDGGFRSRARFTTRLRPTPRPQTFGCVPRDVTAGKLLGSRAGGFLATVDVLAGRQLPAMQKGACDRRPGVAVRAVARGRPGGRDAG